MENKKVPKITETITIIKGACSENCRVMAEIHRHLVDYGEQLQKLVDSLQKLSNSQTAKLYPTETKYRSDFHNAWIHLSESVLNPTTNFNFFMQTIRFRAADSIRAIHNDYKTKCEELLQKVGESVHNVQTSHHRAQEAHKHYEAAGKAVQDAYNSKSPKLQQLRDEFVKAQNAAVDAHNQANEQRSAMSTSFDQFLSDFETLEQWRFISIREALLKLSSDIERTAYLFSESANDIKEALKERDLTSDSKTISSFKNVKDPEASIGFQCISVPSVSSKFLNMTKAWEKELKEGAKIARAVKDFRGVMNQIDVRIDEQVLVLENQGEYLKCKNVNDCVGLIPADALMIQE
ncbi:SH3 domain containing protein [Histomonas meleagridis]|uniref:SH3 domain containing protein n=1 Tax=Histomonas meleagridis TaxID=135588 RepID=UPI00355959CD|nr:SH3 domain containing protein [Histomonas meleagridis]KAH0806569.1 SH3 domain containing protein [Histomonas meleagridis]